MEHQLNMIDTERCARLRWKGLYVGDALDSDVPGSDDQLFWCNRTQTCLGPDGKAVDKYECDETRACYEKE
jgi:hypothetical protein